MDFVLKIINWCSNFLSNTSIPVSLNGTIYDITLMAILVFTAVLGVIVYIVFSAFK